MSNIINLLPDSVANQIAAGEVIQRPASAVKELLENAVDAGATNIKVILKDSGKTLIQVIDNGTGMSEADARMSFERHATSKITKADDLFNIRSKGFRGEALASIAAIAHVELKSREPLSEIGTCIEVEGSEMKDQSPCNCAVGTSFSVKNLFYNVPARRNFLKSDAVEFRHIIEEFERISIPHPELAFSLYHNNQVIFQLETSSFRQRIIALFGANYNERLVAVEQETNIINLSGYIGKPEHARRTRSEQYFFVNKRFIKSPYLHHAVQKAYEQLLSKDSFPSYFILMDVDPKTIDINIHPTKTEIKFEDERSVYAILLSSIKRSLGKYNITPTIDFDQEMAFANIPLKSDKDFIPVPGIKTNPNYNPFKANENWEHLYESFKSEAKQNDSNPNELPEFREQVQNKIFSPDEEQTIFSLHGKYIVSSVKSGLMLIDQQGAHERILYEYYLFLMEGSRAASQRELFPKTIEFNTSDTELIKELQEEIKSVGFDLSEFGKNTFVINGVPADLTHLDCSQLLESLLETYKQNRSDVLIEKREQIAKAMAKNASIKEGKLLNPKEMQDMIDRLFACAIPSHSITGKAIVTTLTFNEIERLFKK